MKKISLIFASLLSTFTLTPGLSLADPIGLNINIQCPITQGSNRVTHHGDYIGGFGTENIENVGEHEIYFKSNSLSPNIPADLLKFVNVGVEYDSATGTVTCKYNYQNLDFALSYTLTNGKGGAWQYHTANMIVIRLPVGLN